jgi:hypothetical protein
VRVVAEVPAGQRRLSGSSIRIGGGSIGVRAVASSRLLITRVVLHRARTDLTIGHVLPRGALVDRVWLDGRRAPYDVVRTARGRELVVETGRGTHSLAIRLG